MSEKQDKEEKNMAISMAVIPTLKGSAAKSLLKTLDTAHIKPYSNESKANTEKILQELLLKRDNKK